jgi:chromosome condensin MukBEF complex kleisin-like MukF subunit
MLGEYFQGTLPQLIERARLLKGKIPRTLPRDYGALIRTCETELDNIIGRLRALQQVPAAGSAALHHARPNDIIEHVAARFISHGAN